MWAFISVIFIEKLYLNNVLVMLVLGCIWVPQIYTNTFKGYRNTPCIYYAICTTMHALAIPVYIKGASENFLGLKPHPLFMIILVVFVALQVVVLGIQQSRPRFLLPQYLRDRMMEDYYRYETTFEDDAKLSTNSFLS